MQYHIVQEYLVTGDCTPSEALEAVKSFQFGLYDDEPSKDVKLQLRRKSGEERVDVLVNVMPRGLSAYPRVEE